MILEVESSLVCADWVPQPKGPSTGYRLNKLSAECPGLVAKTLPASTILWTLLELHSVRMALLGTDRTRFATWNEGIFATRDELGRSSKHLLNRCLPCNRPGKEGTLTWKDFPFWNVLLLWMYSVDLSPELAGSPRFSFELKICGDRRHACRTGLELSPFCLLNIVLPRPLGKGLAFLNEEFLTGTAESETQFCSLERWLKYLDLTLCSANWHKKTKASCQWDVLLTLLPRKDCCRFPCWRDLPFAAPRNFSFFEYFWKVLKPAELFDCDDTWRTAGIFCKLLKMSALSAVSLFLSFPNDKVPALANDASAREALRRFIACRIFERHRTDNELDALP